MGVPKLNKWLLSKCSPKSIQIKNLSEFQDKRIAVDISIYMYRFLSDGRFMENLYLFLSTLRYYCIHPVIIFDGKAPIEKRNTIQKRNKEKQEASKQYNLIEEVFNNETDCIIRQNLESEMTILKKRMIRITWAHIDSAIELIEAFGFEYYLAPYEADQLCVHLALKGDVYAVLSDDMDNIISGVPRILRTLNLSTHQVTLYDTKSIFEDIKMTIENFRQVIVLSGTDYEIKSKQANLSIKGCFELYNEFKNNKLNISFYDWLEEKSIVDTKEITHICTLFDSTSSSIELDEFLKKNRPKIVLKLNLISIRNIMRNHKFIFPL
jgi:hypothetical protein